MPASVARYAQSGRLIERRSNFGDDSWLIGRVIEPRDEIFSDPIMSNNLCSSFLIIDGTGLNLILTLIKNNIN